MHKTINAFLEIQRNLFLILAKSFPIFLLNLFKLIFDGYQHLVKPSIS